ncbi:MAG: toll/interleukin-1 receptor domain-containing protein [Clostridia bacterium]|nr:toll/interleukin-1 receptor domain-containing protein [Clostridia bacterium]
MHSGSDAMPKKDIFISYRDQDGANFAKRLSESLKEYGYSVYYNPDEKRSGSFPDQIREAIRE